MGRSFGFADMRDQNQGRISPVNECIGDNALIDLSERNAMDRDHRSSTAHEVHDLRLDIRDSGDDMKSAGLEATKQTMKGSNGFKMPKSSRPYGRYVVSVRLLWLLLVSTTACFGAAPMGWNSWNSFANIVNSQIVQEQAKALASNGMKEAGYEYVVIDEGWWLGARDASGNIVVDPKQWPAIQPGQKAGDMSNIAALHSQPGTEGRHLHRRRSRRMQHGPRLRPEAYEYRQRGPL